MNEDEYITIESFSYGIYKEKGSRFLAYAIPVTDMDDIKQNLDRIKKEHHEARHHCYAYMLGQERNNWRINDDGEPSGTAGRPILGQINSFKLTNIIIIVCRYFGGTLLGTSGLINAYKSASLDAIQNASIINKNLHDYYEIKYPYAVMNDIMKILKDEHIDQSEQDFNLECRLIIHFRKSLNDQIINRFSRIEGLIYKYIETR